MPKNCQERAERNSVADDEAVQLNRRLLIKMCCLFKFVLPRDIRRDVFEPAFEDMLAVYLEGRRQCSTRWMRWWMDFTLVIRSADTLLRCGACWIGDYISRFRGKD